LVFAQEEVNDFIEQIQAASNAYVSEWKYNLKDLPNGADPSLDDSGWEIAFGEDYRGETVFITRDSLCWFRKLITIPEAIWGTKVEGGKISLVIKVAASGNFFVNGKHIKSFEVIEDVGFQAEGQRITLTENARTGEKLLVAIRAKSQENIVAGVHGESSGLGVGQLELDKAVALSKRLQAYITGLQIADKLLNRPTEIRGNWATLSLKLKKNRSKVPLKRVERLRTNLQ
jgi:hypothetical protein